MPRLRSKLTGLPVVNDRAAAIDIGSRFHVVAVPPHLCDQPVQTFQAFTGDLQRMADWIVSLGIKTVAMESTGVYWIPAYEILEGRGLEVIVANARESRAVPGRTSTTLSGCSGSMPAACCAQASDPAATSLRFEPICGFGNDIWTMRPHTSSICRRR
jgi:hypothetical protein